MKLAKESLDKIYLTPEEIIKKNIPNGIVNIKAVGGGNGRPQYRVRLMQ